MSIDSREQNDVINWFRAASPYINNHRGKTLVMAVPGSHLRSDMLPTLTHDLTLLSHLGIRLVVCFGLRAVMDDQLAQANTPSHIVAGRRVTDADSLATLVSSAGIARHELESQLSMGLPNTPMAGARLAVSSGNYVTAQPFGVHGGVDFQHTGLVREIHATAINALLDAGHLVILPPLGFSLTGEVFNVTVTEVATECAIALGADKLIYLVDSLPSDQHGKQVRQASVNRVRTWCEKGPARLNDSPDTYPLISEEMEQILHNAINACNRGVDRVHLLDTSDPNALLRELFTRDGSGTMITAERWEHIRAASIADVGGIIQLISPLQADGTLVSRSREELELDIEHFVVSERDGMIVACAALYLEAESSTAEIACIATHPDYQGEGRADQLLTHLEQKAKEADYAKARILSTHTGHWFVARGYAETLPDDLPPVRLASYNHQRNSKIYCKSL